MVLHGPGVLFERAPAVAACIPEVLADRHQVPGAEGLESALYVVSPPHLLEEDSKCSVAYVGRVARHRYGQYTGAAGSNAPEQPPSDGLAVLRAVMSASGPFRASSTMRRISSPSS